MHCKAVATAIEHVDCIYTYLRLIKIIKINFKLFGIYFEKLKS